MIFSLAFFFAAAVAAEAPKFSLTIAEAESAARAHALDVKAAAEQSASARAQARQAFSLLLPSLTLDGGYRYQTEVPQFSVIPGQPAQPFGSHRATSIGPTLSWTLWDEGELYKTWRAQEVLAQSREENQRLLAAQATLAARLAYIQVQLAREKIRLLADSVALADAQYADIEKRLRAGAVSRIDALSSDQEDLRRRKDFFSAQSDLAGALRELFRLTGGGVGLDSARPIDVRISTPLPVGLPEPTLRLDFDRLEDVPAELAAAEAATGPSASHPAALAYAREAEAARLSANAAGAGRWPKVQLQGAIAYEYPNGPVLQSVTQKSVGLTASMPLFEGRAHLSQVEQHEHLALATERRREMVVEQLTRDWDVARAALLALRDQQAIDKSFVAQSEELAHLAYLSYQAGRSTYLEAQTYALAALQAKVDAARTQAQILIELSTLAQLRVQG